MGFLRKLHDEELHNLCSSSIIVKVIRSMMMKQVGHATQSKWEIHAKF